MSAEDAELFFVDFLEHRALVELRSPLQIAQQVFFGAVDDLELQIDAGFGAGQQVLQAAPARFQLLERGVVQHLVQLEGKQVIDLRDTSVDRSEEHTSELQSLR